MPSSFIMLLTTILGLAVGSFLSALNYRLPLGRDWVSTRSQCPSCGTKLGALDLIPVLSWLMARGKCRHCHKSIGPEYLAIEIITGIWSFTCLYLPAGIAEKFVIFAAGCLLLLMGSIDLRHKILPDSLQIILAIIAVTHILLTGWSLKDAAIGAAIAGALAFTLEKGYFILRKKPGLGMGDVKFFPIAGWWCGALYFPLFMFMSGIFGVILGLAWKKIKQEDAFPFGPAMFAALLITIAIRRFY